MWKDHLKGLIHTLYRERVFALLFTVTGLVVMGAWGYFLLEPGEGNSLIHWGRGLWWSLVTLTTTGYGDIVPETLGGRLVAVVLMAGGLITISLLTATVASVFIGRKYRQQRGLEPVKVNQHLLILGWHDDGAILLKQLFRRLPKTTPVVLVNTLPPEQLDGLKEKFAGHELAYVWGDFSREDILHKANVAKASKAVILAGRQEGETAAQVDQRCLLTALTLRSLNPKIIILAELLRPENRPYLERAGVDEVLVRGQYDASLIAGAVASPGVYHILINLLLGDSQHLWTLEVPARYHGRPVKELAEYLKKSHQALLLALYSEGRGLALEDLLSGEPSPIDDFIRRKFSETGMTYLFGRAKVEFQINPPETQILEPRQQAVVIAPKRPELS